MAAFISVLASWIFASVSSSAYGGINTPGADAAQGLTVASTSAKRESRMGRKGERRVRGVRGFLGTTPLAKIFGDHALRIAGKRPIY